MFLLLVLHSAEFYSLLSLQHPPHTHTHTHKQSYMNLTPGSQHVVSWAVTEGVTMELVMARVRYRLKLSMIATDMLPSYDEKYCI
jgi:hypothetical protein